MRADGAMSDTPVEVESSAGPVDYFAVFGLPRHYDIDLSELERRYLELSKKTHPDRFVDAPARQRAQALSRSMVINDAYKALKRPVSRAEHLLALHGVVIGANESIDATFLVEILELREELLEAKQAADSSRLHTLEDDMLDRRDQSLARLAGSLAAFDTAGDRDVFADAKRELIVLRYISRYLEEFEVD